MNCLTQQVQYIYDVFKKKFKRIQNITRNQKVIIVIFVHATNGFGKFLIPPYTKRLHKRILKPRTVRSDIYYNVLKLHCSPFGIFMVCIVCKSVEIKYRRLHWNRSFHVAIGL